MDRVLTKDVFAFKEPTLRPHTLYNGSAHGPDSVGSKAVAEGEGGDHRYDSAKDRAYGREVSLWCQVPFRVTGHTLNEGLTSRSSDHCRTCASATGGGLQPIGQDGRHWISCPHGIRLQRSVHHPVRDTLA